MLAESEGWRLFISVLIMCQSWGPWNKSMSVSSALLSWGNCLCPLFIPFQILEGSESPQ